MKREILALAVVLSVGGWPVGGRCAEDAASLLAKGKLAFDSGDQQAAGKTFEAVADDAAAPAALRAEALVRLGLARKAQGDAGGAADAFERVWNEFRHEKEAVQLLVQAVYAALPGAARWDAIWQEVVVEFDRSDPGNPVVRVEWPGVPSQPRRYSGAAVTLELRDGDLQDVFRLFADTTQLNIVVHPGVQGQVTMSVHGMPWDEALDRMLAPNGLAATHVGNMVEIGLPARLGTSRPFDGKPISVQFNDVDLIEALRRVADNGGRTVSAQDGISGKVTIWLKHVPWDQAFDLLVRLNRLTSRADGTTLRIEKPAKSK
jgi:hypothetical protein